MTNPTAVPQLKPGWQTTEFWVALVTQVLALLGLLGVFNVDSSVGDAIIKLAALVAAALGTTGYAVGRGNAKHGNQIAKASVLNTQMAMNIPAARGDAGLTELGILGLVLLIGGIVVAVISSGSLLLLIIGVVAAVSGAILLFGSRGGRVL